MTLSYETYHELVRALMDHPEWRAELRPLILGEEIQSIPSRMDRVEAALERLEAAVRQQGELFRQQGELIQQQGELIRRNSDDITLLARELGILNERVNNLEIRMDHLDGRMGNLEGGALESRYRELLRDWFTPYVTRPTSIRAFDIEAVEQADQDGRLNADERQRLVHTDIFVTGVSRSDRSQVVLACEVSTTVNLADVERAEASARVLRGLGLGARGFVGGHAITEEARSLADQFDQIVDLHRKSG